MTNPRPWAAVQVTPVRADEHRNGPSDTVWPYASVGVPSAASPTHDGPEQVVTVPWSSIDADRAGSRVLQYTESGPVRPPVSISQSMRWDGE